MLNILHRLRRRLFGAVTGEAMQSGFHFILNIFLVHTMTAHDYGIFSIVMIIGGIGLTYVRALAGMPASVFIGRSCSRRAAELHDVTFGSVAVVLSTGLALVTYILLQAWLGKHAFWGGLFVFLWSLRSYMRTASFALGYQRQVLYSDALFTITGVLSAVLFLSGNDGDKLFLSLNVLVFANAIGILATYCFARRRLRFSVGFGVRQRFLRIRHQLMWSAVSVTTANLQGQGLSVLVAGLAGPEAYAPIAAGLVMFVPLRVVAAAFVNIIQPVVAGDISRDHRTRLWAQARTWTMLLGGISLLYGLIAIPLLPLIRSSIFEGVSVTQIGLTCWVIFSAFLLYVMPRIMMESANAMKAVALITLGGAVVGMSLVYIILQIASPSWSLIGAAASELFVLLLSWIYVVRRFPRDDQRRQDLGFKGSDVLPPIVSQN